MFGRKRRPGRLDWARGRLVVIRPDGARRSFDPTATRLLLTDEKREIAAAVLRDLYAEDLRERIEATPEETETDD